MRIILRQTPIAPVSDVTVDRLRVKFRQRPVRVLDFDIENRPLTYLGSDFTTAEVTAIAWAWTDAEDVTVYLLGEHPLPYILARFVEAFNQADMVTGHYIKGHDLPMLNGALVERGMPALQDKLVQDTKTDLIALKGISKSQESLGSMFKLEAPKVQMNQTKWREANRLTPEGLAEVRARVVGDVRQHMAMRQRLLDLGYLAPARVWRSGVAKAEAYVP